MNPKMTLAQIGELLELTTAFIIEHEHNDELRAPAEAFFAVVVDASARAFEEVAS
jgi:hypothetical protein